MISLKLWSAQKSSPEIVFPNESQPADICERMRKREEIERGEVKREECHKWAAAR